MKFVLFYLLNVEKISSSFNSFLFNKRFQEKQLLTNLSLPSISSFEKIQNIKQYESIFNDSEYKINLWKGLNIYDFEF
jgi:hypothetical protein